MFQDRSRLASTRRRRAGATALEFALTFPVMLAFIYGILEWGFFMGRQAIVVTAAQEGGRVAVATGLEPWDNVPAETRARLTLTNAGIDDSTATVFANWDGATPGTVTVTVSLPYTGIVGAIPLLPIPTTLTPSTIAATHLTYVPR